MVGYVTTMHVTPRYRGATIEGGPCTFVLPSIHHLILPSKRDVFDRIRWGAGTHFWGTACFKIKGKTKILYVLIFIKRGRGGLALKGKGTFENIQNFKNIKIHSESFVPV